ncbi:hypothetical protein T12_14338 [Trichinella patagoniensis]|uniref:Uncharacterized protein n=1 Tax=Trichinella patagoniensis TaxID=990121 RepID=A0A0V0Z9M2_9BILA|nr:hypothetical protein T12_14338 [Trichinella patagoniensis]
MPFRRIGSKTRRLKNRARSSKTGRRAGGSFWKQGREPTPGCGRSRTIDRRAATAATPDKLPPRLESGSCQSSRSRSSLGKYWNSHVLGVHGRTHLDAATKFACVLSSKAGRAGNGIATIPVTVAHYRHAVGILEKRFGRPKIVARAHFLALWKAPTCLSTDLRCLAMGKDPHAGELPLSEAVMPGLKEKFPRALQRVWYLKVGAGPESEDNLEFAQLQVNSLSLTGDPGLEE